MPTTTPATRNARAVALLDEARRASPPERLRLQQQVVLDYVEVARAVANRFRSPAQDYRDLCQVAYIGLTKAVQRFEPTRGRDIVSFAVPTISGEIKRYLRDSSWAVRPPRRLQELWVELGAELEELSQRLGREPTVTELAAEVGEPASLVAEALHCIRGRRPSSIESPVESAGSTALREHLSDEDAGFERVELAFSVSAACAGLTQYQRRILYLRFFEERTQSEIAAELGVSQMQVSRLLRAILQQMRARLAERSGPD